MKINTTKKTIVMTKKEAKLASRFGTTEYYNLVEVMKAFPKFRIETRATNKTTNAKGLSYDFMKEYIEAHDDEQKSIMTQFEELTATSVEAKALGRKPMKYVEVKDWFLKTYKEFDDYETKRNNILNVANSDNTNVLNSVA